MDYGEALAWLYGRQRFGVKMGLDNITRILERLGRPQDAFRALHVTGTNGKGSTCAFLASCLQAAGHPHGLYTSPHLVSFRERIVVDGKPASPEDVASACARVKPAVEAIELGSTHPTYFECVTGLAFDLFRARGVPYVVLEVGMGGRLDATNVCSPAVAVITNVGLEHTQHLGTSVQAVAREKAGILKPGVPAVTGARGPALDVVAAEARRLKAPLRVARAPEPIEETPEGNRFSFPYQGPPRPFETALLGSFQAQNAALALAALEAVQAALPVPPEAAQAGLRNARWAGRLETLAREPWTLLDGAHNAPAMEELAGFLDRHAPHRDVAAAVGILRDKNASKMLQALAPRLSRIILTTAPSARAVPAAELARLLPPEAPPTEVVPDVSTALRRLMAEGTERVRLVTGSLFLVGEARAQLLRLERDPKIPTPILQ